MKIIGQYDIKHMTFNYKTNNVSFESLDIHNDLYNTIQYL